MSIIKPMKNNFPYQAEQITVTKDMCDHNDHMNVAYYYQAFDLGYTPMYFNQMGFSDAYFKSGFSTFTLEDNIRYLKEFRLGEPMQPAFCLYNVNNKLVHIVGGLYDKEDALCAIFETVLGHIDMNKRQTTNFSDTRLKTLIDLKNEHANDFTISFELKLKIKDLA